MPRTSHALGIDLGGTKTEALLLDSAGQELWRQRIATPAGDYAGTLQAINALVDAGRTAALGQRLTVGIGTPGSLTSEGLIKNANSTCLNGRALQSDLQALLKQEVRIANDANCLALSEATDGAGRSAAVVFAAILGTGVGAGITVNGHLLRGPNSLAGEWGHNPLPWADAVVDDPKLACYCGQRHCNELLLSGPGITRDHLALTGVSLNAEQIAVLAQTGDAACLITLERHASRLARALAAVINVLACARRPRGARCSPDAPSACDTCARPQSRLARSPSRCRPSRTSRALRRLSCRNP